jgi:hypothetical protein
MENKKENKKENLIIKKQIENGLKVQSVAVPRGFSFKNRTKKGFLNWMKKIINYKYNEKK